MEEKVDVLAMDVVSVSLVVVAGLVALTLGLAGWKSVGGRSSGNPWCFVSIGLMK